jgi:hypothetical protein
MNSQNFTEMYAARFRPLTEADGLREWTAMIAQAEPDRMREALDSIADHHRRLSEDSGKTIAPPRLGEVKAALARVAAPPVTYIPPSRPVTPAQSAEWARALEMLKNTEVKP